MARNGNLKDFQEALARRLREAAQSDSDSRLGIEAGSGRYLVKLDESGEVLPVPALSPVPLTRPWLLGLANVRGSLASVIDLAAFAGEPPAAHAPESRLVLLAERFGCHCGLVVARMLGLKDMRGLEPRAAGAPGAPWIGASYADADGAEWRELDLAALAAHEGFLQAAL
jgi:twitching motility protein PilI